MKDWRPHPGPQEKFHQSSAFELLYGGSAGGGKTDSLLMEATRQVNIPTYKAILFRRTYPELETSLIMRAHERYPWLDGKSTNNGRLWNFPSGASIRFAHLEHESDVHKYQSAEFDFIGFDELTTFTEYQYLYLFSRCRGTTKGVRRYIRGATNPGNVGHVWVKQRFVEGREPFKVYTDEYGITRCFIPARVYDNPTLIENDPHYISRLKQLPEKEQKMLLEGDWDVFEGQFFNEWSRERHVVDPFEIPPGWLRIRGIDYGRTAPFCCLWAAIDYDGNVWIYREYYEAGRTAQENGSAIRDLSAGETYQYTVADPSIFGKTHLPETIADVLGRVGVHCTPASNDRIAGWNSVREYLKFDDNYPPKVRFFSTCHNSIRTIPQLIHDDKKPEDCDTSGEDHAADSCRYILQTLRDRKTPPQLNRVERMLRAVQEKQSIPNFNDFYRKT